MKKLQVCELESKLVRGNTYLDFQLCRSGYEQEATPGVLTRKSLPLALELGNYERYCTRFGRSWKQGQCPDALSISFH